MEKGVSFPFLPSITHFLYYRSCFIKSNGFNLPCFTYFSQQGKLRLFYLNNSLSFVISPFPDTGMTSPKYVGFGLKTH